LRNKAAFDPFSFLISRYPATHQLQEAFLCMSERHRLRRFWSCFRRDAAVFPAFKFARLFAVVQSRTAGMDGFLVSADESE